MSNKTKRKAVFPNRYSCGEKEGLLSQRRGKSVNAFFGQFSIMTQMHWVENIIDFGILGRSEVLR